MMLGRVIFFLAWISLLSTLLGMFFGYWRVTQIGIVSLAILLALTFAIVVFVG